MADKQTITVMPMGVATAVGQDLQALNDLRDTLADEKHTVVIQNPEYPTPPPDGSMTGVGIVLKDIPADDEHVKSAVKHASKATRRWLRKRFADDKDARTLHVTIWSKDARRLSEVIGSSEEPFRDVTPEPPKPEPAIPVKLVGVWDTIKGFTWATRIFLVVSLLFGLMMLAYLWATDANIDVKLGKYDVKRPTLLVPYDTEWLHSHAYIPNILAGATGFLIGAPFALVVLATFTVQREERSALQRVNNLSALAWDKFRDSIYDFCSDERASQGLSSDAYFVEYVHNQIYDKYQHYIKLANTLIPDENRYRGNTDAEIAELQAYLKERSAVMQQMIYDGFKTIGTQYWLQIKWSIIRTNWNTLNQYVRLQRLERNLLWFKDELDAEFMNRLSDQHHPLTDFMTLHGLDQSKSTASMEAALAVVRRDVALPLEELAKKMLAGYTGGGSQLMHPQYYYEFGRYKVQGHREAAQKASQFLFDLRRVVNDVEREGWPKRFNRPVVSNYRPWMPN